MMSDRLCFAVLAAAAALSEACEGSPEVEIGADVRGACTVMGIDPLQQTGLGSNDRSHWLQPWRSYLDTWPAKRMREATGITMPSRVADQGSDPEAWPRLLGAAGVAHAYLEVQWSRMRFEAPQSLEASAQTDMTVLLTGLRKHGVRPMILLYGYVGVPVPTRMFSIDLKTAAPAGARTILISPEQAQQLIPGRSGLSDLTGYKAAEVLFTAVTSDGQVTLSKPLPMSLPSGPTSGATLAYEPFFRPLRVDGTPEVRFEATLAGYISYVTAIVAHARAILGDAEMDIKLWNGIDSGSQFLDVNQYYDPPIDLGKGEPSVTVAKAILARTAAAVRAMGADYKAVRIGNGFANTLWFESEATLPPGVDALDRHADAMVLDFPIDPNTLNDARANARPVNALGEPSGRQDAMGIWLDAFTPRYRAFFPELALTAIEPAGPRDPGQLIRDLSPLMSVDTQGNLHGRGAPDAPSAVWVRTLASGARAMGATLTAEQQTLLKQKMSLRSLAAYVSKGADTVLLTSDAAPERDLVDAAEPSGGPVIGAIGRFLAAFAGPDSIDKPRKLSLVAISNCSGARQFSGDGTAAHPDLLDRDVVAFFPFQASDKRFVVPVYVMTRDLTKPTYVPTTFELTVGGVDGIRAKVQLTDPLTTLPVEAKVLARQADQLIISLPLTDSPRLLKISEP